jgi:hypothetical protein
MTNHSLMLDAFADARRSWDELISLQPDIYAAAGNLEEVNLAELGRRVDAHRAAIDVLADALETEPHVEHRATDSTSPARGV